VEIAAVDPDVVVYVDLAVPLGETLTYRVRAYNSYGNSGYSNVVSEKTKSPIPPGQLKKRKAASQ